MVKKPRLSLRDSGIGSYGIGTGMGCRIPWLGNQVPVQGSSQ